jgi:hypothetical protein
VKVASRISGFVEKHDCDSMDRRFRRERQMRISVEAQSSEAAANELKITWF